jgi:hypothetical protein
VWDQGTTGWRSYFARSLSDAFWLIRTGTVAERGWRLKPGFRFVSRLLLTHELGLIEPEPVVLPAMPSGAGDLDQRVADLFALLYGLRWAHEPEVVEWEGIAFTKRFVAEWLGVPSTAAQRALAVLEFTGVIVRSGWRSGRSVLWWPGAVMA